jgi:Na+-driven multidrug efflux pump
VRPPVRWRSLAAEPLYLLVDTAMVGHLGTDQLAALAIAATLLAGTFTLFNFLTYGTTGRFSSRGWALGGALRH